MQISLDKEYISTLIKEAQGSMTGMEIVKRAEYEGVEFNCYVEPDQQDKGAFWATREQIGRLLEYENPEISVANIHNRHRERLDRFATLINLIKVEGSRTVTREVTVYSFKGLLEICRYSNQPKADAVMDFLWEIADEIRRTGSYGQPELNPVNIRAAEVLQKLALQISSKADQEEITREAYRIATGHELPKRDPEPKAKTGRYCTAEQIGKTLKWPADAVLHRAENLQITMKASNGYWDGDTWYFSKDGRRKFLDLVGRGIVKISDGYEYYDDGYKLIHWSYDAERA